MKKLLVFLLVMAGAGIGYAQALPGVDTAVGGMQLKAVSVTAHWKNDTERYQYNQMKYYVTTILPYLDAATSLFKTMDAKLNEPGLSRRERRQYIQAQEKQMRGQFEDKVKDLNVTQGGLLVKLLARQTSANLYGLLAECKSPIAAIKWQAWARLNGMNLDKKYDPAEEPRLELIMDELGYPLPAAK